MQSRNPVSCFVSIFHCGFWDSWKQKYFILILVHLTPAQGQAYYRHSTADWMSTWTNEQILTGSSFRNWKGILKKIVVLLLRIYELQALGAGLILIWILEKKEIDYNILEHSFIYLTIHSTDIYWTPNSFQTLF